MKRAVAIIALLIGVPLVALGATTVSVGGVSLQIPEPDGYVAVTPEMSAVNSVLAQTIPPANEKLVAFIPKDNAAIATRGELPNTDRYFIIEVARSIIYSSISDSNFAEIKNNISETNRETMRRVEQQFPALMKNANTDFTKKYGLDLAGATVNSVPFPIHTDSSNSFSYSMFVKYNIKSKSNSASSNAIAVTTTFVHVKGKVLFLYCYSSSGNLLWSRSASKRLARDIIEANR